ncbi:hypothetical protein ILUMI_13069 [Ignelater luminosus]|uniref:PiggyBac transposable element-derived protein domain-containing protein n=1 Tax=Ignelater luminosus TaxID=2038154 RepID=A0A8K0GCC4_IGNLU|nr:hypothetical protein ILUMI_13069 [Ignelater luminosus]
MNHSHRRHPPSGNFLDGDSESSDNESQSDNFVNRFSSRILKEPAKAQIVVEKKTESSDEEIDDEEDKDYEPIGRRGKSLRLSRSDDKSDKDNANDPTSNFGVSVGELKVFYAILMVSGYSPKPHNSNLDANNKFAKIRPLTKHLNEKFIIYVPPHKSIDIDESMVSCYSHRSCKQRIQGKPIRHGFKFWSINLSNAYVITTKPYQGRATTLDYSELGLGASVVTTFAEKLKHQYPDRHHYICIDRLPLVRKMTEFGFGCTDEEEIDDNAVGEINGLPNDLPGTFEILGPIDVDEIDVNNQSEKHIGNLSNNNDNKDQLMRKKIAKSYEYSFK